MGCHLFRNERKTKRRSGEDQIWVYNGSKKTKSEEGINPQFDICMRGNQITIYGSEILNLKVFTRSLKKPCVIS